MTGFEVLLAGAVVPGGVHPPVWPVVECVVYWMVTYFEEGNVEVAVGFAAFAVAERREEDKKFSSFSNTISKFMFSLLTVHPI